MHRAVRVGVLLPMQVVAAEAERGAAEVAAVVLHLVARAGVAQVHRAVRVGVLLPMQVVAAEAERGAAEVAAAARSKRTEGFIHREG